MSNLTNQKYFDLHAGGIGYLNRTRMVSVKGRRDEYLCCQIAALRGEYSSDGNTKPEVTKFDLIVYGDKVKQVIERLKPYNDKDHKIMVQFKISDFYPEIFIAERDYGKSIKKGDPVVTMKGRLLQIYRAWVNGEPVDLSDINQNDAQGESWYQSDDLGNSTEAALYSS